MPFFFKIACLRERFHMLEYLDNIQNTKILHFHQQYMNLDDEELRTSCGLNYFNTRIDI